MSDHLPIFTILDICSKTKQVPKFVKINRNDPKHFEMFSTYIEDEIPNRGIENDLTKDPDPNLGKLDGIMQESRQKYLEPKIVKFNRYKHKINPWMTEGILRSMKFRDRLYKKMKKLQPTSDAYLTANINLKTYKSILQKIMCIAKIDYFGCQFEKHKNDIKRTWTIVNDILNRTKKSSDFPKYFMINGEKVSDDKSIADSFNSFFANVGPNLSKQIQSSSGKSIHHFLTKPVTTSFSFSTISPADVIKIIQELKPKASFGHDNISSTLLKLLVT